MVEHPEPMTFRAATVSRRTLTVMVTADVVVGAAAAVQALVGTFPALAFTFVGLVLTTLAVARPTSAVDVDGVRVPGRKQPVPWSQVEAFNGYLRDQVLVVEQGRVEAVRLRGACVRDLPALRAWLVWARNDAR